MNKKTTPTDIILGMKGAKKAFYLDESILQKLKDEEASVKAVMNIGVTNEGFNQALERDHVICVVKDTRFRPPPEPTVVLRDDDGKIMGMEVFPHTLKEYESREDIVWMGDGFVLFPEIQGSGNERFIMPPIPFPELNEGNGCMNVISCSPATTSDMMIKEHYDLMDDPRLATILVAYDDV